MDLILSWKDSRLLFNSTRDYDEIIPLAQSFEGILWVPDIYVLDESVGKDGFSAVQKAYIHNNGLVEYSRR